MLTRWTALCGEYKGEFNPIPTKTPGIQICEHFLRLAQRSDKWALVRSLTHKENGHDKGTYVMLTGSSVVPPTFRSAKPQAIDLPSIAAIAGYASEPRRNMPPSVILPERIYHLVSLSSWRGRESKVGT